MNENEQTAEPTAEPTAAPTEAPAGATEERKTPKSLVKRYLIDAFSGMALGLFCTLIAGTMVSTIGELFTGAIGKVITYIGMYAKTVMGAGIGVGIAFSLKSKKLTMFTAAAAGMAGANIGNIFALSGITVYGAPSAPAIGVGDPVAAYFASVACVETASRIEGKTPVDVLVVPLCGMIVGAISAIALGIPFGILFALLGRWMAIAVGWNPIIFGIIISVVMGLLLTLPTSSAAFGVMLFSSSLIDSSLQHAAALAAGAACAGCCAHTIGFAVASFRENRWGGLVSQGIGTSMLQIPNLAKNPKILLPAVSASIVSGPLSAAAFGLTCDAVGSGMGTAGLVGVIRTFAVSVQTMPPWYIAIGIAVCYFIVPALVALCVSELMRRFRLINYGDMKLPD